MKIKSHAEPEVWYERKDDEIIIHEEDSDRIISAPADMAMRVLYFKKSIMTEISKVIGRKELKCPVCGRMFVAQYPQVKTCSTECQTIRRKEQSRSYATKPKKHKPARKSQIVKTEKRARAAGMSYGQYKAQETIEMYGRVKL